MKYTGQILAIVLLGVSSSAIAAGNSKHDGPIFPVEKLDKIRMQLTQEQWVSTDTAKVIVGVDASLDQDGLDKLQGEVKANLTKLAKSANWRITTYQRNQDQSGLEKVHMEAQARLPEGDITDLRSKTEKLSKPGTKYSIVNIQYTPSEADKQQAASELRDKIYARVKEELSRINQTYTDQNFFVHRIAFGKNGQPPVPMRRYAKSAEMNSMVMASAPSGSNFNVSQKMVLVANVVLAAKQD